MTIEGEPLSEGECWRVAGEQLEGEEGAEEDPVGESCPSVSGSPVLDSCNEAMLEGQSDQFEQRNHTRMTAHSSEKVGRVIRKGGGKT